MSTLGERIKELRLENNETQEQLAAICNVTRAMISLYEHDRNAPSIEVKRILADHFRVTMDYLSGYSNIRSPENMLVYEGYKLIKVPIVNSIGPKSCMFTLENIEGYIFVAEEKAKNGTYFFLRAKGDSMINARIMDGDLVYVRKQSDVNSGDIALVLINDQEGTLKRILKTDHSIILHSENPTYNPLVFSNKDIESGLIRILGKVLQVTFEI